MKTLPKVLAAVVAVTLFGAGSSFAEYPDRVLKRIEHPNGPPTFAYVPVDKADGYQEGHTVGLYRDGRGVTRVGTIVEGEEEVVVDVPVHRGRGDVIYVPVRRWLPPCNFGFRLFADLSRKIARSPWRRPVGRFHGLDSRSSRRRTGGVPLPPHFMRRKNEGEHLCVLGYLMFEGESERPNVKASFWDPLDLPSAPDRAAIYKPTIVDAMSSEVSFAPENFWFVGIVATGDAKETYAVAALTGNNPADEKKGQIHPVPRTARFVVVKTGPRTGSEIGTVHDVAWWDRLVSVTHAAKQKPCYVGEEWEKEAVCRCVSVEEVAEVLLRTAKGSRSATCKGRWWLASEKRLSNLDVRYPKSPSRFTFKRRR